MAQTIRERLTQAVRHAGTWSTVYLDQSGDRENPEGLAESRRRSVRDRLDRAGAPESSRNAVDEALGRPTGLPAPLCRYLLVRDGEVVVDESIPGSAAGGELVAVEALPLLAPLIRSGIDEFAYLVVQVSRDGGDIALHRTGAFFPEDTVTLKGRTDTLHKANAGGWAQLNHHEHVEELWKRTQDELSTEVDRLVVSARPRLVVVSGDIRARGLLLDALAERTRALVAELPKDTRAEGADDQALAAFVAEQVAEVERRERADAVDLLRTRLGHERPAADRGLPGVVEALRQAQADTVFVDVDALEGERLLALADVPWIASTAADVSGTEVIGEVQAAEAVVRAALLTDARILLTGAGTLGAPTAALLRWPVDQPASV